jgi:hypothetical protein
MTAIEMFEIYLANAFTTNFIVGGECSDVVKFQFVKAEDLVNNLTVQDGSGQERGAKILRLLFSKGLKKMVNDNGITLCTKKEFEELAKKVGSKGRSNRGLALEKLVTEYFGQEWHADNKKFTECGDIEINGISYQIKGHKATFTNELTIKELAA